MTKFINNKYLKIYNLIIENASKRPKLNRRKSYFELHHIIPRSLNGSDDKDNLVQLSAREHYICHQILTKITNGRNKLKMLYAFEMMNTTTKTNKKRYVNSKTYERWKVLFSKNKLENFENKRGTKEYEIWLTNKRNKSLNKRFEKLGINQKEDLFKIAETCDTLQDFCKKFPNCTYRYVCVCLSIFFKDSSFNRIFNKTPVLSEESRNKMALAKLGKKRSLETRMKISKNHKSKRYGIPFEVCRKISETQKGRIGSGMSGKNHSKKTIEKMKNRKPEIRERIGLKNKNNNEIKRLNKLGVESKEKFIEIAEKCKSLSEFRDQINCEWWYVEKALKHWFGSSSFYKAFNKEKPLKKEN